MSLKAGRVGVNPADVDPVDGHISPSSVDGYTKAEADAKFETQQAANALQPKQLAVPIKYLNGSVVGVASTVEDVFQASYGNDESNPAMTNQQLTQEVQSRHINKKLEANTSFSFYLPDHCVAIVAINQPYGATKGLYLVAGGYTTSSSGVFAVSSSEYITITKTTNNIVNVATTSSAFVTVLY